jgi:hypothetical protein
MKGTGCHRSPYDIPLFQPIAKILVFGHNVANYNISQMKDWYVIWNQFSGSFYWQWFRRNIDLKRISRIVSGDS